MLPKSTAEILALKVLGETTSETWVAWAVEMLMSGFDGEYLVELAGESPPYNGWKMDTLIARVLEEQKIDISKEKGIIRDYVCQLVEEALAGDTPILEALRILKELFYYGCVPEEEVSEFMGLYWSKEDEDFREPHTEWQWPRWWPWKRKKKDLDALILEAFRRRQLQCRQDIATQQ